MVSRQGKIKMLIGHKTKNTRIPVINTRPKLCIIICVIPFNLTELVCLKQQKSMDKKPIIEIVIAKAIKKPITNPYMITAHSLAM